MGGRSAESRLNGRRAEEIVAQYQNEPVGDSGIPWEGDNIDTKYLANELNTNENQEPQRSINLNTVENKVTKWLEKDTFTLANIRDINILRRTLEQEQIKNPSRRVALLLQDINKLLREIR